MGQRLAQFVVETISRSERLGLVIISSANFRDGIAYISAIATSAAQGSGMMSEAIYLSFNYAFSSCPFRKIYMEATERSYSRFASGLGRLFTEEGRLREHRYWNGKYEDVLILAVTRTTWQDVAPRYLRLMTPTRGPAES